LIPAREQRTHSVFQLIVVKLRLLGQLIDVLKDLASAFLTHDELKGEPDRFSLRGSLYGFLREVIDDLGAFFEKLHILLTGFNEHLRASRGRAKTDAA
jgi:hypothetical protein